MQKKNAKHSKIAHAQYKIWQNIRYVKMQNRCKKKTSMKLHDCEAIEIESVEEVSIGLQSAKKALRKCHETNKRFPSAFHEISMRFP